MSAANTRRAMPCLELIELAPCRDSPDTPVCSPWVEVHVAMCVARLWADCPVSLTSHQNVAASVCKGSLRQRPQRSAAAGSRYLCNPPSGHGGLCDDPNTACSRSTPSESSWSAPSTVAQQLALALSSNGTASLQHSEGAQRANCTAWARGRRRCFT
jgi:hypothetical protein